MQAETTETLSEIDNDAVVDYLTANPEFFINNQEILARLGIPHDSGNAVSLIEKQVGVLRGKCSHLETSLRDLIAVARQNEHLHQRLHELIQETISAASLAEIVSLTQASLQENFNAEGVHILLIAPAAKRATKNAKPAGPAGKTRTRTQLEKVEGAQLIRHTDKRLKHFTELFDGGETVCGLPNEEQLQAMVGKAHGQVASAAMIPLFHERKLGVVMLSSRDESRFGANRGVMFLNQLGQMLSRRIHSYGIPAPVSVK